MAFILYLVPVPATQMLHPDCDLKTMPTLNGSLWGNKNGAPRFFWVIAKNSLINNVFEEEKSLIVKHDFFGENSSVLGAFRLRRRLQANHGTVRKSAISPQPGNQKQLKWSNTAYLNKRSFIFKIKFYVSSNKELKRHSQLMHMRISYHFLADLHVTGRAWNRKWEAYPQYSKQTLK